MDDFPFDNEAMLERCSLVYFDKRFRDSNIELDEATWAKCLLGMAENFDEMPTP